MITSRTKKEKIKIRRASCASCNGERNCKVRGQHQISMTFEHITGWTNWYLLQCAGCDYVFTQKVSSNSEDWYFGGEPGDYDRMEYVETISYLPALSSRKKPDWMTDFGVDGPTSNKLDYSLVELYRALDAGLNTLTAIGIRTCFDIASEDLEIDSELPFGKKLEALVEKGQIGHLDKQRVGDLIDAGSASAHRGWKPNEEEINTMMEVLEHFVYEAFVSPARKKKMDESMKAMKEGVPKRRNKK